MAGKSKGRLPRARSEQEQSDRQGVMATPGARILLHHHIKANPWGRNGMCCCPGIGSSFKHREARESGWKKDEKEKEEEDILDWKPSRCSSHY